MIFAIAGGVVARFIDWLGDLAAWSKVEIAISVVGLLVYAALMVGGVVLFLVISKPCEWIFALWCWAKKAAKIPDLKQY